MWSKPSGRIAQPLTVCLCPCYPPCSGYSHAHAGKSWISDGSGHQAVVAHACPSDCSAAALAGAAEPDAA